MNYFFEKLRDLMLSGNNIKLTNYQDKNILRIVKNMNKIPLIETNIHNIICNNEKYNKRIITLMNEEIQIQVIMFRERYKKKQAFKLHKRFNMAKSQNDLHELIQDFLNKFHMIYRIKAFTGPLQSVINIANFVYNQQIDNTNDYYVKIKEMELLKMLDDGSICLFR